MFKALSKYRLSRLLKIVLSVVCFLMIAFWFVFRPIPGPSRSIPQGWGSSLVARFKGQTARLRPPGHGAAPFAHPFMAATSSNNMHVDSLASDVHLIGGPLGYKPNVKTYAHGSVGGECATVTFDSRGNIVTVCATFSGFALLLMEPRQLHPIARMDLPSRPSTKTFNLRKIMTDTSGGAYFFLDHKDRAVLVDAEQKLRVVRQDWTTNPPSFVADAEFDLSSTLRETSVAGDAVTAVLPDTRGNYWFVSRQGVIGAVEPASERVSVLRLDNEEIQNSFAVDDQAVYVVSDRALYALVADPTTGKPTVRWREPYERSTTQKPGMIGLGSGTTPTISDEYVVIADNAEPQTNLLIFRRDINFTGSRLVCKHPVFEPGKSATENSIIAHGGSFIIENNYGYDLFLTMMFGKTSTGGVTRVDLNSDGNGCTTVWTSPIKSQTTVPKLSLETGLVYVYAKDPDARWGIDAYYLAALDFATGKTVFEALTGTGVAFDNNWAPITLGPNRCAYIGSLRGLIQLCDGDR